MTALSPHPEIRERFSKDKVHATSAETLRGIKDRSVGAILASASITYSVDAKLVLASFDRVLEPGGVLKVNFPNRGFQETIAPNLTMKDSERFELELAKAGYDFETRIHQFDGIDEPVIYRITLLVAVKPGNPEAPKAKDLLNSDLDTVETY